MPPRINDRFESNPQTGIGEKQGELSELRKILHVLKYFVVNITEKNT